MEIGKYDVVVGVKKGKIFKCADVVRLLKNKEIEIRRFKGYKVLQASKDGILVEIEAIVHRDEARRVGKVFKEWDEYYKYIITYIIKMSEAVDFNDKLLIPFKAISAKEVNKWSTPPHYLTFEETLAKYF